MSIPDTFLQEPPSGLRWVGSTLMDEEQIRAEGWTRDSRGYVRAGTLEQLQAYGRRVHERREADFARRAAARSMRDEQDADFRRMYPETRGER
jgi:hypothetical protein